MFKPSRLSVFKWLSIVPAVIALVDQAIEAFQDGRLSPPEIEALGAKLVRIVAAVA